MRGAVSAYSTGAAEKLRRFGVKAGECGCSCERTPTMVLPGEKVSWLVNASRSPIAPLHDPTECYSTRAKLTIQLAILAQSQTWTLVAAAGEPSSQPPSKLTVRETNVTATLYGVT